MPSSASPGTRRCTTHRRRASRSWPGSAPVAASAQRRCRSRCKADRDVGFGKADLQDDEERQHEEQEQPEERDPDDHMPPAGGYSLQLALEFLHVHERSTTPLSSSHHTYT